MSAYSGRAIGFRNRFCRTATRPLTPESGLSRQVKLIYCEDASSSVSVEALERRLRMTASQEESSDLDAQIEHKSSFIARVDKPVTSHPPSSPQDTSNSPASHQSTPPSAPSPNPPCPKTPQTSNIPSPACLPWRHDTLSASECDTPA